MMAPERAPQELGPWRPAARV